ncbi:uncharacterized protein LOC111865649 [Cryptotermes secundus]|uniref:uncharacterized protein LOC111865649 n=1 Tax=Cryptotermes secundus TaxID=105785 RepID=UPI001454DF39|nr:uncharacterized protein LOC111865649 [Cryptotermes secundus]
MLPADLAVNVMTAPKATLRFVLQVESDFYKITDICFDDTQLKTLYSNFTFVSGIGGYQVGFPRPSFIQDDFYPEISVDNLYTRNSADSYLARGHYTAKADFVYGSQHRATFHFVNISPQWQTFNGANWNALEMSVRTYADRNKLNLDVNTGTYGVATLPNVNGIENEYVQSQDTDYLICNDVHSKISWLQWDQTSIEEGYSLCCDVDEFRSTVSTLPEFSVSGLLIYVNICSSCSL